MKTIIKSMTFFLMFITSTSVLWAGTISGSIKFDGEAPVAQKIDMGADPTCASSHTEPVYSEQVLVNENGMLQNVFVYVKEGLGDKTFPTPSQSVMLDQKGCHYTPHVLGIQVNQKLEIINSDPTLHNVHGMPTQSKEFNLGMPIQGMKLNRTFTQPEVMVKFKCDVHPWMNAYIGVLSHPYFGVSDNTGTFEIKDLPAGTYVIEAWHELYGTQTQEVTVTDTEAASTNFTFSSTKAV